jgi:subtilase family serine protease
MLNFEDTAYPRFKKTYSENELQKLFFPSEEEIESGIKNFNKFCGTIINKVEKDY